LKTHLGKDFARSIQDLFFLSTVLLSVIVGSIFPYFHAVSVGKVYLSLMSKKKRFDVLKKIGLPSVAEHTITEMEVLEKEIRKIKKYGYGFEDQELREGVRRVAAPIFNAEGHHIGSIRSLRYHFQF